MRQEERAFLTNDSLPRGARSTALCGHANKAITTGQCVHTPLSLTYAWPFTLAYVVFTLRTLLKQNHRGDVFNIFSYQTSGVQKKKMSLASQKFLLVEPPGNLTNVSTRVLEEISIMTQSQLRFGNSAISTSVLLM